MKIIYTTKKVVNETTKQELLFNNYYIVLNNGKRIAIRPTFKSDYAKLRLISEYED